MPFSIVFWQAPHNNAKPPMFTRHGSPSHFSHATLLHLRLIHWHWALSISRSPVRGLGTQSAASQELQDLAAGVPFGGWVAEWFNSRETLRIRETGQGTWLTICIDWPDGRAQSICDFHIGVPQVSSRRSLQCWVLSGDCADQGLSDCCAQLLNQLLYSLE